MIGKKILNYEIKSLIGEGGMGNVYLAEHTQLGRKVAIKSLHPQLVKNESLRARFKNEAATMAHLQHKGIVTLFDYAEEADALYLVMEYVDGLPLDEYIRKVSGPIPADRAIPLMKSILDGFAYAHSMGVIHRDIKPSNILITKNGEAKILDFGIAKLVSDAGNKLTKTGTQLGTVFYMSPEQVKGFQVDHRSDIYSLGVTFFQMLTGVSPYEGMTTDYEIYNKIVQEPLPQAAQLYPGVPPLLDHLIQKVTAKDPQNRFQSCQEFIEALGYVQQTLGFNNPVVPPLQTTTITPPPPGPPGPVVPDFTRTPTPQQHHTPPPQQHHTPLPMMQTQIHNGPPVDHHKTIIEEQLAPAPARRKMTGPIVIGVAVLLLGFASFGIYKVMSSKKEEKKEAVALVAPSEESTHDIVRKYYTELNTWNLNAANYFADTVQQYIMTKNITIDSLQSIFKHPGDYTFSESTLLDSGYSSRVDGANRICNAVVHFICYRPSKSKYQDCYVNIEFVFAPDSRIVSYKELLVSDLAFSDTDPRMQDAIADSINAAVVMKAQKDSISAAKKAKADAAAAAAREAARQKKKQKFDKI